MAKIPKKEFALMNSDIPESAQLQDELEQTLLERLQGFIQEHPDADSARFAVSVFLAVAGRIGVSHLGAKATAECMETTATLIRKHGKKGLKDIKAGLK